MDFNWKDTLKKVAPLAATMIGGPWGGLAAAAIGAVFNGNSDTPPDEQQIAQWVATASPDQLMQIKQIDADLRIKLREFGIKEDELVFDDKDSARKMQMENKSWFPAALSTLLTLGFFSLIGGLMAVDIPEANENTIYLMTGSLGTAWVGSIQFWFGTTKGSSDKTAMLGKK